MYYLLFRKEGIYNMRMRFKPFARPELAAWEYSIDAPRELKGKWRESFADSAKPLRLELGCGKGSFIAALAASNQEYNHIGVDIKSEMLVLAKRNIEKEYVRKNLPIHNVLITNQNIEYVQDLFSANDAIDRIYINFCNPWYKTGDAKHRLTHPRQLIQYRDFLRNEGDIYFKTDDTPLFEDSLRYFEMTGFEVTWLTRDLHADKPCWNIRTEHENMFSSEGIPIKACIAVKRPALLNKDEFSKMKDV